MILFAFIVLAQGTAPAPTVTQVVERIPWYDNPLVWVQIVALAGIIANLILRYMDRVKIDEVSTDVGTNTELTAAAATAAGKAAVKADTAATVAAEAATHAASVRKEAAQGMESIRQEVCEVKKNTDGLATKLAETSKEAGKAEGAEMERLRTEAAEAARLRGVMEGQASVAAQVAATTQQPQPATPATMNVGDMRVSSMDVGQVNRPTEGTRS